MLLRNTVILWLTLTGSLLLVEAAWRDPMSAKLVAAGSCFLLAYVYAQLTRPR